MAQPAIVPVAQWVNRRNSFEASIQKSESSNKNTGAGNADIVFVLHGLAFSVSGIQGRLLETMGAQLGASLEASDASMQKDFALVGDHVGQAMASHGPIHKQRPVGADASGAGK
jgi:hypothetical protein